MTIVFATNDINDFPGAGLTTSSTNFRSSYVGSAFSMVGTNVALTVVAKTIIPPVAGDITWIHFQYRKNRATLASDADGNLLFELRAGDGTVILDFDLLDGTVRCNLFGSSTLTVAVTDDLSGDALQAIDVKIDLTSDISVEVHVDEVLKYDESQAWSSDPGNPEVIVWRIFDLYNLGGTQYISELIVADESSVGMSLAEMTPDAAGNYSAWQGDHVETGNKDVGTGVSSDATGEKLSSDLSTFGGPSSSALRALVVNTKASVRGGTVGDIRNFLRIDSTDYNGADFGATDALDRYITVWDTNPDTAADWDTDDFTGVEIGIESLA